MPMGCLGRLKWPPGRGGGGRLARAGGVARGLGWVRGVGLVEGYIAHGMRAWVRACGGRVRVAAAWVGAEG